MEAGDAISPIVDLEALGSAWRGVEDKEGIGGEVIYPRRLLVVGVAADGEVGAVRGSKIAT